MFFYTIDYIICLKILFNSLLKNHQINAINNNIKNNFNSGLHFHATGTGKSIIAKEIILEYLKINNNVKILIFFFNIIII